MLSISQKKLRLREVKKVPLVTQPVSSRAEILSQARLTLEPGSVHTKCSSWTFYISQVLGVRASGWSPAPAVF